MPRRHAFYLAAVAVLSGCATGALPNVSSEVEDPRPDSEFVSPKNNRYRIIHTGEDDIRELVPAAIEERSRGCNRWGGGSDQDTFHGCSRRSTKVSIARVAIEEFDDLVSLRQTLEADDAMINRSPSISHSHRSRRVSEEKRNVKVDAFLIAAKREDDRDFHLIVGTSNCDEPQCLMNIELSGLPRSGAHRSRLKRVRNDFFSFFGDHLPRGRYDKYDPPIPIAVSGSLFFDISHRAGLVGPRCCRPDTAWEIHPITDIRFEEF